MVPCSAGQPQLTAFTSRSSSAATNGLSAAESVTLAISSAGGSKVRDGIDTRLISELESYGSTGELISDETVSPMYGPGTIASGSLGVDTDGDGFLIVRRDVWRLIRMSRILWW